MTREKIAPVAYRVRTFAQLIEASDSGVRELIARGDLKATRVGGLLRIPASELVKFTGEEKECPCGCDAGHKNQEKEKVHA